MESLALKYLTTKVAEHSWQGKEECARKVGETEQLRGQVFRLPLGEEVIHWVELLLPRGGAAGVIG